MFEVYLGVELLRRTTRSLSLTEAGRAYRKRCADVLGEIDAHLVERIGD